MFILLVTLFFALGAVVASFIGVLVARLHTGEGFLAGRSRCDACGAPLDPLALVPIVSYVASRGRAICCDARISPYSTVAEFGLGALYALAYVAIGLTPALAFFLLALAALLALVLYDLAHQILPPSFLAVFIAASALARFCIAGDLHVFGHALLIATLLALFFALVHLFSRGRAMGLSDAPLALGLALLAGPQAFAGFMYSFWIGAGIGIVILARRPRGSRMGVEVPFAPFLAAGFLLAFFSGWNIFTFTGI